MSPVASAEESLDYVSPEDISLFKRTLVARRFPGLQAMPDSEIIKLIRAERRATGRKLVADTKTRPKTQFTPPPPKRELQTQQPLPFVPVSAPQAKEMTARPNTERFINVNTPYEAHREDFNTGRLTDSRKGVAPAPFKYTCASQAKENIKVNYYLNSPMDGQQPPFINFSRAASRESQAQGQEQGQAWTDSTQMGATAAATTAGGVPTLPSEGGVSTEDRPPSVRSEHSVARSLTGSGAGGAELGAAASEAGVGFERIGSAHSSQLGGLRAGSTHGAGSRPQSVHSVAVEGQGPFGPSRPQSSVSVGRQEGSPGQLGPSSRPHSGQQMLGSPRSGSGSVSGSRPHSGQQVPDSPRGGSGSASGSRPQSGVSIGQRAPSVQGMSSRPGSGALLGQGAAAEVAAEAGSRLHSRQSSARPGSAQGQSSRPHSALSRGEDSQEPAVESAALETGIVEEGSGQGLEEYAQLPESDQDGAPGADGEPSSGQGVMEGEPEQEDGVQAGAQEDDEVGLQGAEEYGAVLDEPEQEGSGSGLGGQY